MKLHELYLIPEAIEKAVSDVLAARTKLPVFISGDADGKGAPWLEVECELGEATGHYAPDATGLYREDAFSGTLRVRVVSRRDGSKPKPFVGHSEARAKVQCAMAPGQGYFGEDVLPYHSMQGCAFQGAPFGTREDGCDATQMEWKVMIAIRATAWAEVTP